MNTTISSTDYYVGRELVKRLHLERHRVPNTLQMLIAAVEMSRLERVPNKQVIEMLKAVMEFPVPTTDPEKNIKELGY